MMDVKVALAAAFMPGWLKGLPDFWKAILALCAAIAFGMTLGGWLGLPGQVQTNTVDIKANRDSVFAVRRDQHNADQKLDRIICLLELGEGDSPLRCGR